MSQYISPEQRAKVIASVKEDGMSIMHAAKTHSISEKTVRKWLRQQTRNAHTSSTEVQRLRQEVQDLRAIIGKVVYHQETKKKSTFLSS